MSFLQAARWVVLAQAVRGNVPWPRTFTSQDSGLLILDFNTIFVLPFY